jgi:hypothetical protein
MLSRVADAQTKLPTPSPARRRRRPRALRPTSTAWALVIVAGYRLVTLVATLLQSDTVTQLHQRNTATSVFGWWDGQWYLRIAQHGYDPAFVQGSRLGRQSAAAFPPALAALMAATHRVLGVDYTVAGLLWGFAALVALGVGLVRLVELDYSRRIALLTLGLLLLWPPAMFLGMLYQDGITLAGVVWAFVFVRRNRPVLAGVCLGIATLGKLVALAALLALLVEYAHTTGRRRPDRGAVALVGIPLATLAAWLGYSGHRYHHLTAALDAERAWGHQLSTPWRTIQASLDSMQQGLTGGHRAVLAFDFVAIGVLVLATGYLAALYVRDPRGRRIRPSYVVYTATMLVVLTTNGRVASLARYALLVYPVFLAAALALDHLYVRRRAAGVLTLAAAIAASTATQLWLIGRFARYYWAG